MLGEVWSFLRGDAQEGLYQPGRNWSKANGYQLAGPRWEIYGEPDPSAGHFDVEVSWSLVAP